MYFKFKVALGRTISAAALPKAPNLLVLLALLAGYGPTVTVLRDPSQHFLLKSYALASANRDTTLDAALGLHAARDALVAAQVDLV